MNWIVSANKKLYNYEKALFDNYHIDWSSNANFMVGDLLFMYGAAPVSAITHICEVIKTDITNEDIVDDGEYWVDSIPETSKKKYRIKQHKKLDVPITIEELKRHGLSVAPQGPVCVDKKPELNNFLSGFLVNYYSIAAGEQSVDKQLFFDESIAAFGWQTGDLRNFETMDELKKVNNETTTNFVSLMCWTLKYVRVGDIIYLKEGMKKIIARGVVTKGYYHVNHEYPNRVGVAWQQFDAINLPDGALLPRSTFNRAKKETIEYVENFGKENIIKLAYGDVNNMDKPIQKIYIGPPGSGKSYKCRDLENVIRIVFHPEYENSDFIGSLLPVTNSGNVTYEFVPGPFTKALEKALNDPSTQYNLLIEEMTRGNCAAIFGEVFQLLDRDKETGISSYPIYHHYLEKYLEVNSIVIPSNLNIIGTVNSSDQNVFPMDTAFKRRFQLEYVKPIEDGYEKEDFDILEMKWSKLCRCINSLICDNEHLAEDKQIGFYFITKPDNKQEEVENLQKLCIYLWHDVDKFIHESNNKILNHKFYNNFGDFTTNVVNENTKLESVFSSSIIKLLNNDEERNNESN